MECKGIQEHRGYQNQIVLMEPKWNVKLYSTHKRRFKRFVLMEPKWNVKSRKKLVRKSLISINGTKVECKDFSLAYSGC